MGLTLIAANQYVKRRPNLGAAFLLLAPILYSRLCYDTGKRQLDIRQEMEGYDES